MEKIDLYLQYIHQLKPELQESLNYYTKSSGHKNIKNITSGSRNRGNDEFKHHIQNITDIFNGAPTLDTTLTVYRGLENKYKDEKIPNFISTSLSRDIALNFTLYDKEKAGCCLYVITLTPGNYGILPLMEISNFSFEEEILLPPGILSMQKRKIEDDMTVFYCTYIPKNTEFISTQEIDSSDIKMELSDDDWINRILESDIIENIEKLCLEESNYQTCVKESLDTLDYTIPEHIRDKFVQFMSNIQK